MDVNTNEIPDDCETDVRVVPVVTMVDPATTSEVRTTMPDSLFGVTEGTRYFIEVWASDVGDANTGLLGVYVDVSFCQTNVATALFHGSIFDDFTEGTIQSGLVDEFGGAKITGGGGIEPEWVRVGWIEMTAGAGSNPCDIELNQSINGIARVAAGPVLWPFVELGSVALEVTPTTVSYDLYVDNLINFWDLALFTESWLESVPPGDEAHDFDCDLFVGPGDLSWFATGWGKTVGDPTILYPPCPGEEKKELGHEKAAADIEIYAVALSAPSPSDMVTSLPASLESVTLGTTYYVELWSTDSGDINTGLTSLYVDVEYANGACSIQSLSNTAVLGDFDSGYDDGVGLVSDLGGSTLDGDIGSQPNWIRVGVIEVKADGSAPAATFSPQPSATGSAAWGRGLISWNQIELGSVIVQQGIVGDIDSDGDKDADDLDRFIAVLLGTEQGTAYRRASDFNGDSLANGLDSQLFVGALLEP